MNFKQFHESKNLFDYSTTEIGAISTTDGSDVEYNDARRSDFIPVQAGVTYTFSGLGGNIRIFEYKPDKTYRNTNYLYTIPVEISRTGYIRISGGLTAVIPEIMLNEGSTALSYEPYSSEVWHDIPHYIHNTSTDTLTTPADIYANDTTATVGLKGNMVQSGTPTPTTPIQPSETGERTNNLFDAGTVTAGRAINDDTGGTIPSSNFNASDYIDVSEFAKISILDTQTNRWGAFYDGSKVYISGFNGYGTITVPQNAVYVRVTVPNNYLSTFMLNGGDTLLPYELYGVKIPILSANTTTPVYLGEVQTTRKIKKLVLTGEENWTIESMTGVTRFSRYVEGITNIQGVCSHFSWSASQSAIDHYYSSTNYIFFFSTTITTETDFKTYLAQQYANGTPVTVWYILATPTTGIVNEPLRKIGTYADEVSGITIPTIAGTNTLSIGTTLQPSEVTVNYKGWHPVADVHVYPDSSWMPTSWEEFRKAVRSGKAQSLYPVGTKLYENWGDTTSDAWIVVDYPTGEDYLDSDLAQQGYTNRVMLMEEKLNYLRQFDAIEAWLYVETAIPAGTYRFTIPNYDASYGGNKTYIFTSTADVPVGGQLTLTWAYQQNPSAVQAYSSATSTSALFNVSITEWDGTTACTDLGTIKLAQNDADSTYGKLNHIHRARYGSNNYAQSGYRQWLNTNASANWWTPTNVFDRPYDNRTNAGRLNVMNSNMKSVLATPTVNCITNNLFEYPSLDGTTFSLQTAYTVTDKLFPVTHSEINS